MGILDYFRFGRSRQRQGEARQLYLAIAREARAPVLYERLGVPDSFDGRFDALVLHMALVLARLADLVAAGAGRDADLLARDLASAFVDDMDRTVREIGVGDLSVGKHVKQMSRALYGRTNAYHEALADSSDAALHEALCRNIWAGKDPEGGAAATKALAHYVRARWNHVADLSLEDIRNGLISSSNMAA